MSSDPARDKARSHEARPNIMTTNHNIVGDLSAQQVESLFSNTLKECTRISTENELQSTTDSNVVMAKMLRHCIRMLHSNNWVPRTVVRAMVHMEAEADSEMSVKSMLHQAMREKRDEAREARARKAGNIQKIYGATPGEEAGGHEVNADEKPASTESAGVDDHNGSKNSHTAAAGAGAGATVDSGAAEVDNVAREVSEVSEVKDDSKQ